MLSEKHANGHPGYWPGKALGDQNLRTAIVRVKKPFHTAMVQLVGRLFKRKPRLEAGFP
jgi:hypothetical protein